MRPHSEHSVSVRHLVFLPFCSKYLCNDVFSLFSSFFPPLAYLVILQGDKLTHSRFCTELRRPVCVLTAHTKRSVVFDRQSAPLLEKFTKGFVNGVQLLSIKSILFLFNNTGVSLCNYDVEWLLTPCRRAPPALAGRLAKREVSFRVDQLAWRTNGENAVRRQHNKCYRDYFSCVESHFCVHLWL